MSLAGNTLPFHKPSAFENYVRATQNTLDLLDERRLERAAVELIVQDSIASRVVAKYLVDEFECERPAANVLIHNPEIAATETKLSDIFASLRS